MLRCYLLVVLNEVSQSGAKTPRLAIASANASISQLTNWAELLKGGPPKTGARMQLSVVR
jgi:hypothetical protein